MFKCNHTVTIGGAGIMMEGTETITAGNTEKLVTHNKGILNYPTVTPLQAVGRDHWIEYINVNSFKIHIDFADLENNLSFNYRC